MARHSTDPASNRAGKKSKHPISALAKNKMSGPGVKFVDWRADSGERIAVARANISEKFAHMRASMKATFVKIKHPIHPFRKSAAKKSAKEMKEAATARKVQAVANAHSSAARKKAVVRERRAQKLNQNV